MIVSAPPHPVCTSAMLHRHDPRFHPRFELFSHLFSDIVLLDNSPLVLERGWGSESRRSVRCAANENEGSILVVRLVNRLDTPMNPGRLSLAKLGDRNPPFGLVPIEHWRPGDRLVHPDGTYKLVSRMNMRSVLRTGRWLTTSDNVDNERRDSVHGMHGCVWLMGKSG